jgi:hypothetical protein
MSSWRRFKRTIRWRLSQANPLLLVGLGCVAVAVVGPSLDLGGVSLTEFSSAGGRAALGLLGAGLLGLWWWSAGSASPLSPEPAKEQLLVTWRDELRRDVLKKRVSDERSDLHELVRLPPALDHLSTTEVDFRVEEEQVTMSRGRPVPWSKIASEWCRKPRRGLILGPRGYGKTVEALRLIRQINASPGARVAEMFRLGDWYRWRMRVSQEPFEHLFEYASKRLPDAAVYKLSEYASESFSDWLVHELVSTYPIPGVAAKEIVASGSLLLVLDGLEEIPLPGRRICTQAINAYASLSPPVHPFVLTCDLEEYVTLNPYWVEVDWQVELVGLEPDAVAVALEERTLSLQRWDRVRDAVAAADAGLLELFSQPAVSHGGLGGVPQRQPL